MNFMLTTPRNRKILVTYGIIVILSQPVFSIAHYAWNEAIRPYPWYADSLAIPIFGEILIWLLLAPIAIITVVRATRNYQAKLPILQTQIMRSRFVGVNVIFGLLISYALLQLIDVFTYANVPMLLDVVLSLYLLLAVRAIVMANWRRI